MTHNELEDLIIEDWTWRKKEISDLVLIAEGTGGIVILKSIILLLYAHWEGYIKKSSRVYLKYIINNKIKVCDLTENFKAIALKGLSKEAFNAREALSLINELNLIKKYSEISNLTIDKLISIDLSLERDKSIVNTQDNLSAAVFKNILTIIGLKYNNQYEIRKAHLENDLLAYRNSIGHGNKRLANDTDFNLQIFAIKKLRDIMYSIIENFRDEIIYYSKEKYFLKENLHKIDEYTIERETQLEAVFKEIESRYA
jgi:hypothetical protein